MEIANTVRKFKRWLPQDEIPQGRQQHFWIDAVGVTTITSARLQYGTKAESFTFELAPSAPLLDAGTLVRLLPAKKEGPNGREEILPTAEWRWINPAYVFAIGSLWEATVIWMRPTQGGTFQCTEDNGVIVLIPVEGNPGSWSQASTPEQVAKVLGIELEN